VYTVIIPNIATPDEPGWWQQVEERCKLDEVKITELFLSANTTVEFHKEDPKFCTITFPNEEHLTLFLLQL
jgi:hypothetical protein